MTAVGVLDRILDEVFGRSLEGAVDVHYGSHRAEFESARKLEELRGRSEPILTELLGFSPKQDADGDWVFPYDSTQVFVDRKAENGIRQCHKVASCRCGQR